MKELNVESIRKHLQDKEVQERVLRRMREARSRATVTISRAANLFGFSESQLREWEKRGLLQADRTLQPQDGRGHRQYSPEDLDKLALIRELIDQDYGPSEIPSYVDEIWRQIVGNQQEQPVITYDMEVRQAQEQARIPIDRRVELAEAENFWRYFVSQVLRLSLLLICEDVPDTIAGLIVPLQEDVDTSTINEPKDLYKVGSCLIGWLGLNKTFYTFLDAAPTFDFPSDFRIMQLPLKFGSCSPLLVIQRKARTPFLAPGVVETIQKLLQVILAHKPDWQRCFDRGMRDWVYQVIDFDSSPSVKDVALEGLTNIAVELGGKTSDGENRWHFCDLYLPQDSTLPIQQRVLVVRASSKDAPNRGTTTTTLPSRNPGLTSQAYQSGQVIYRPKIASNDPLFAYQDLEPETRSAIAIPVGNRDGLSRAALYVASKEIDAFSLTDQRALRLITRMIEELLSTYQARWQVAGKLADIINYPRVVDPAFRNFLSEGDFIYDLTTLLTEIQERYPKVEERITDTALWQQPGEVLSIIAVDIDNQSNRSLKYGERIARNLSREVGTRLRQQLSLISDPALRRVYHVNADRYYLLLKGMPLDEAKSKAAAFHKLLCGEYHIDATQNTPARLISRENLMPLSNVTVRLGVMSYPYIKLKELLQRHLLQEGVAGVVGLIIDGMAVALELGQKAGGNCIIIWNPDTWDYAELTGASIEVQ
jgi:DNA-binding transcriptional MerR regulator/GGDEF domain-containing protein